MKKLHIHGLAVLMLFASMTQTGCIGSFSLTGKVLEWNKSLGNKFVNELVFLVFLIVPVYGLSVFIDAVIINTIEFWSGSNPVSMKPGEKESQLVQGEDGNKYLITASRDRFDVLQTSGSDEGRTFALVFDRESMSWAYESAEESITLTQYVPEENAYHVHYPDGSVLKVDANTDMAEMRCLVETNRTALACQ